MSINKNMRIDQYVSLKKHVKANQNGCISTKDKIKKMKLQRLMKFMKYHQTVLICHVLQYFRPSKKSMIRYHCTIVQMMICYSSKGTILHILYIIITMYVSF